MLNSDAGVPENEQYWRSPKKKTIQGKIKSYMKFPQFTEKFKGVTWSPVYILFADCARFLID